MDGGNNCLCCDMCSGLDSIPANLKFWSFSASVPVPGKTQPHKRHRVSKLNKELAEQLKSSLLSEREKYLNDHLHLRFLGPNCVCPTCYIIYVRWHIAFSLKMIPVYQD